MNDRAFVFAQALIFSFFILVGLLALLLPQDKYSRMLERLFLVGKGSEVGKGLQRRLVGFAFVLFGFFALVGGFGSVYTPEPSGHPRSAPNPLLRAINPEWLPLVLGLLVVGVGFFVAFNPELLLEWSLRTLFPERRMPEGFLRTCRITLRVAGVVMIYASQDLFKLWLKR
jgi:uncharacterized membrane protein YedE/YeeE